MTDVIIKKDVDPKRATFDTPYPVSTSLTVLKSSSQYKTLIQATPTLQDLKIQFDYKQANNGQCTFSRCQFYVDTNPVNEIKQLTFKGCTFDHCFLGSVDYKNVRFEYCNFKNCDFSNSRFEYCVFDQCTFEKCSAYHPEFISTEITPSFLNGIVLLSENYSVLTPEIEDSFHYMKLAVAKKVYNSNNSIDSHTLSDQSLFELKKAEYAYLKRLIRIQISKKDYLKGIGNGIYIPFKWLNLKLTNGGTSLIKLFVYSILFILIINLYFSNSSITDTNYSFTVSDNTFVNYLKWLPRTTSIFLAYGYTAYNSNSWLEHFFVNFCVVLGLLSYAMVISVLIRKIYK